MISRFIAPLYALKYQKNHCSPFSLKPWEFSLHDTNSHFGNCPRPSPQRSVWVWVQVTNVIAWMASRNLPLESHTVGIMGIWVHDPIHVGSRLLNAGDSFREVSRALLDGHVNGFIYHLLIAL